MKKKIFAFILLAVAVLSLSLTSFAAGVDNIAPLRIVDEEGNPVLGLSVENAYTYVYSDADGLTDLDVGVVQGKQGTEQADFSKPISFTVLSGTRRRRKKALPDCVKRSSSALSTKMETRSRTSALFCRRSRCCCPPIRMARPGILANRLKNSGLLITGRTHRNRNGMIRH